MPKDSSAEFPPVIRKTPGVIGGDACIGNRRIAVWMLVQAKQLGISDERLLSDYQPPLTRAELDAAWDYYEKHREEIDEAIREHAEDDEEVEQMSKTIEIVNRGRGLQLSTNRITVQDLVPYFQRGDSIDEIIRWIPILTQEEITVVERYYREHKEELDEEDRRIRARTQERVREQKVRFPEPEGTIEERLARLKQRFEERRLERNGEGNPG